MPTFVIIPASFTNGTIEVDILSRLNGKGPADARAFAGVAYRITADGDRLEAVYLRPLNGQKTNPPSPPDQRAIQYFAYPDWKFDRLRELYPDGDFEAGADIGPDEWITLKLDIDGTRLTATVNGTKTLALSETKAAPAAGAVGLFVDIGSESLFSNLKITPRRATCRTIRRQERRRLRTRVHDHLTSGDPRGWPAELTIQVLDRAHLIRE